MILNQIALNPIVHYQQFAQHIQQQLPTLMTPILGLDPASASRAVEEEPLDHEKSSEYIQLRTLVDYRPWLEQLYRLWLQALQHEFAAFPIQQSPPLPDHWHPESAARAINSLGLAYAGCLIYRFKQPPIETIDRLTQIWQTTWQRFRQELVEQSTKAPVLQALDQVAHYFQSFWLESWLHIAELQTTLPSNPAENTNKNP